MTIEVSYTQARARLASLLKQATENRETVIIHRRGGEDVALVAAAELKGLLETAHLLRSPENAARLLAALERAQGDAGTAMTVAELRGEANLA